MSWSHAEHPDAGDLLDHRLRQRPRSLRGDECVTCVAQVLPLSRPTTDRGAVRPRSRRLGAGPREDVDQVRMSLRPRPSISARSGWHTLANCGLDLPSGELDLQLGRSRQHRPTRTRSAPPGDAGRIDHPEIIQGTMIQRTAKNSLAFPILLSIPARGWSDDEAGYDPTARCSSASLTSFRGVCSGPSPVHLGLFRSLRPGAKSRSLRVHPPRGRAVRISS